MTAKENVNLNGNLTVTNTDPATSGITINAGGTVTLDGASSVVSIPGTPPSASIASGDSTLAAMTDDQMFMTFFGMSKNDFRNLPTTYQITCSPCRNSDLGAALATGANTVWVNGSLDLNANGTYGTIADPFIIVVTDNIHVNGNVAIVGIMYSQAAVWDNSGGGTATICGAAIAEGSFTGQGTPNPTYCPVTLDTLKRITGPFARLPGGASLTRDAVDTFGLDMILLDVDGSSEDPLRILTHARSCAGDARIVALVGHHARADPAAMVLAGAHGIVEKDVSMEQLTVAIRKVHAGELWIDRATTSQLISGLTGERQAEPANGERARIASLSAREREVVALITAGLTNKAIGRKLGISDNTVRHHLTSIFAKLETPDRVGLVVYAFRNGLADPIAD